MDSTTASNSVENASDSPTPSQTETVQITSQSHALGIILNAIEMAQRRGAFNLDEAELLARAKKMFIKPESNNDSK